MSSGGSKQTRGAGTVEVRNFGGARRIDSSDITRCMKPASPQKSTTRKQPKRSVVSEASTSKAGPSKTSSSGKTAKPPPVMVVTREQLIAYEKSLPGPPQDLDPYGFPLDFDVDDDEMPSDYPELLEALKKAEEDGTLDEPYYEDDLDFYERN